MTFKLREPGFLRRYEGTWTIKPAGAGKTTLTTTAAAPDALARTSSSTTRAASNYILPPSATAAAPLAAISLLHSSQPLAALSAMQQRLQWGLGETFGIAMSNFSNLGQALGGVWGVPSLPSAPTQGKAGVTSAPSSAGGWRQGSKQQQLQKQQQQQRATTSMIHVETLSSPKISPPYPLNQILKAQAKGQVEDMLDGLVSAAAAQLTVSPLKVA